MIHQEILIDKIRSQKLNDDGFVVVPFLKETAINDLVNFFRDNHVDLGSNLYASAHSNDIDFRGILIIGRDSYLSDYDFKRFKWRSKHTIIQSKSIHCITYDELLEDLKQQIKFLQFIK